MKLRDAESGKLLWQSNTDMSVFFLRTLVKLPCMNKRECERSHFSDFFR